MNGTMEYVVFFVVLLMAIISPIATLVDVHRGNTDDLITGLVATAGFWWLVGFIGPIVW